MDRRLCSPQNNMMHTQGFNMLALCCRKKQARKSYAKLGLLQTLHGSFLLYSQHHINHAQTFSKAFGEQHVSMEEEHSATQSTVAVHRRGTWAKSHISDFSNDADSNMHLFKLSLSQLYTWDWFA